MIKKQFILTTMLVLASTMATAQDAIPAFPGAEGHGRYVQGGRGGKVIHVTNLNNSGTGSLRSAVSGSAKKIIVFDVGGVIPLASDLNIGANTTICGQTAPYPGISELLNKLKAAGIHLCVLSNKPHEISCDIVRQYFGDDTFEIIMGKSQDYPVKPDPTSCNIILSQLNLEKNEVLYAGDSNVDMQTARNAGLTKCGVCWGFRSEEELKAEGADYRAHTPDDILTLATGGAI